MLEHNIGCPVRQAESAQVTCGAVDRHREDVERRLHALQRYAQRACLCEGPQHWTDKGVEVLFAYELDSLQITLSFVD